MGLAMSIPVLAYADETPSMIGEDNEDRASTILKNLYDAMLYGFLPYDNAQEIANQQGISSDEWNNYSGEGNEIPTPEEGDSEGPQVGDTFTDDDGNSWIVVARPENGYTGAEITNIYDAMRYGFILVPVTGESGNVDAPDTPSEAGEEDDNEPTENDPQKVGQPAEKDETPAEKTRDEKHDEKKEAEPVPPVIEVKEEKHVPRETEQRSLVPTGETTPVLGLAATTIASAASFLVSKRLGA